MFVYPFLLIWRTNASIRRCWSASIYIKQIHKQTLPRCSDWKMYLFKSGGIDQTLSWQTNLIFYPLLSLSLLSKGILLIFLQFVIKVAVCRSIWVNFVKVQIPVSSSNGNSFLEFGAHFFHHLKTLISDIIWPKLQIMSHLSLFCTFSFFWQG